MHSLQGGATLAAMDFPRAVQSQIEQAESAKELNPHIRRVLGRVLGTIAWKLAASEHLEASELQELHRDARGALLFSMEMNAAIAVAAREEVDVH